MGHTPPSSMDQGPSNGMYNQQDMTIEIQSDIKSHMSQGTNQMSPLGSTRSQAGAQGMMNQSSLSKMDRELRSSNLETIRKHQRSSHEHQSCMNPWSSSGYIGPSYMYPP